MSHHNLVLIMQIGKNGLATVSCPEKLNETRKDILGQCASFLAPYGLESKNGKTGTFKPAYTAWDQHLYNPHGVVFGITDPALFLYFLARAERNMSMQIEHQLLDIPDEKKTVITGDFGGLGFVAASIKKDADNADWCKKYSAGEFQLTDALYSIKHKTANLDPDQHVEIIRWMSDYALCVLEIHLH